MKKVARRTQPAMPKDFAAALAGRPAVKRMFSALAPSHQREYLRWIDEAKKPETHERRIAKSLQLIADKGRGDERS